MVRRLLTVFLSLLIGFGPVNSQGPLPSATLQPNRLYEGDTLIPQGNGQPERRLKVLKITSSPGSEALVTLQDLDSGAKYTLASNVVGNMAKTAKILRGATALANPSPTPAHPKLDKLPLPPVPALPSMSDTRMNTTPGNTLDPLAPLPTLAPLSRKPEPVPLKPTMIPPPPAPEIPQGEPRRLPAGLQPIELPGPDTKRTAIERSRVLPRPGEDLSTNRPAPSEVVRVGYENPVPLPPAPAPAPIDKELPGHHPAPPAATPMPVQPPKMEVPVPILPPVQTLPEHPSPTRVAEQPKPIPIKTTPAPVASTPLTPAQPSQPPAVVAQPMFPAEAKPLLVERDHVPLVEVLKPYSPDEDAFAERAKYPARYPDPLRSKSVAPPEIAEAVTDPKMPKSATPQRSPSQEATTPAPKAAVIPLEVAPAVVLPPRTRLKLPSREADELARKPLIVDHGSKLVPPTWTSPPSPVFPPAAVAAMPATQSVRPRLPEPVAPPRVKLTTPEPTPAPVMVPAKTSAPAIQPMKVEQERDDTQKLRDQLARQIGKQRYDGLPPVPAPLSVLRNGPALHPGDRLGLETAEAVKELFTAMRPTLRERAATSLAECRYNWRPEVKGVLAKAAVRDPAASVRAHCINLLNHLGYSEPDYLRVLEELAATDEPIVQAAAESALAKFLPRR